MCWENGRYKDYEYSHPIQYDPDFRGPLKSRSCTDILCLLLFLVFIGCWVGIGIYAFSKGDPNTLLVPKDSAGSRCGLDFHVKDKPYLFFFDLTKCIGPTVPFTGCPTTQVCVDKCPDNYFYWRKNSTDVSKLICTYDEKPISIIQGDEAVNNGKCAEWYLPSSSLLNHCIYNIADRKVFNMNMNKLNNEITAIKRKLHTFPMWLSMIVHNTIGFFNGNEQTHQVAQNIVDDLISSWWKILLGIGIAVLTCILYIVILRWIAGVMVWLSLIGVVALLSFAVYFTATKYVDLKNNPVNDQGDNIIQSYLTKKDTWLTLLIISSIVLGIILIILIFLRKRILLAIALIREGSKAVSSVTSVLFFPIFPWVLQVGVMAFGICVGLYLTTTGEPQYEIRNLDNCYCTGNGSSYTNGAKCVPEVFQQSCSNCIDATCKFISMKTPTLYPYLQAINVFGFFWGVFFVSALGQMILAMVFATWYWTFNKSNLPFFAVTNATFQTIQYHLGTLAFGSLIITICRMIRIVLEYIDHKLKKYDNPFTRAIMCCMKCFFWCLEKFLKFINQNAYIMCAIHGKNFCTSAKDAFMLLMRNIIRVFVLDKVTDFLFFLGKILLTMGVGSIAYVLFATDLTSIDNSGLNYELVPVITIMICTFFIATIFFHVYSMAVDTLFLCFLEDCERNDGSAQKPYFMSKNLMKIFGKKNKLH